MLTELLQCCSVSDSRLGSDCSATSPSAFPWKHKHHSSIFRNFKHGLYSHREKICQFSLYQTHKLLHSSQSHGSRKEQQPQSQRGDVAQWLAEDRERLSIDTKTYSPNMTLQRDSYPGKFPLSSSRSARFHLSPPFSHSVQTGAQCGVTQHLLPV